MLSGENHRRAHEAGHRTALIWKELVAAQRKHGETQKADPSRDALYGATYAWDANFFSIATVDEARLAHDLLDFVATFGTNLAGFRPYWQRALPAGTLRRRVSAA